MEYKPIIEFVKEYKTELIISGAALAFITFGYLLDRYENYKKRNGKSGSVMGFIKISLEGILHNA